MRIVSLLPSATETICAIGLREQLVGVTHECDFPPDVATLPRVTHTHIPADAASAEIDRLVREQMAGRRALYSLNLPQLERLRPDLIVTQALCDVCAVAEAEVKAAACGLPGGPRVVNLEPTTLEGVLDSMLTVGAAAGVAERAAEVVAGYRRRIECVSARTDVGCVPDAPVIPRGTPTQLDRATPNPTLFQSGRGSRRPGVIVLEWADPPFTCGHWTPQLVELAGGRELLGRAGEKSRQCDWGEIVAARPDVLVLALCGYNVERSRQDLPLLEARPGWNDLPCVRSGRVHVTDGSAWFSRPGPRLVDALEWLGNIL